MHESSQFDLKAYIKDGFGGMVGEINNCQSHPPSTVQPSTHLLCLHTGVLMEIAVVIYFILQHIMAVIQMKDFTRKQPIRSPHPRSTWSHSGCQVNGPKVAKFLDR